MMPVQFKVTVNGTVLAYLGERREDAYDVFCTAILHKKVTIARLDCTYRRFDGRTFKDELRSIVWKGDEE